MNLKPFDSMTAQPIASNTSNNYHQSQPQPTFFQIPSHPFVAPGLSHPESNNKFLGVFTASHLSICLLISGFGLIVTGLLCVVMRANLDPTAFQAVGISLICFGSILIVIAIAIFVFAIRWGRKKIHVMDRSVNPHSNIPPQMLPIGYSVPFITNANISQNNNSFDNLNTSFNTPIGNQTFYTIPINGINGNGMPSGAPQFVLISPSAPPLSPDSALH